MSINLPTHFVQQYKGNLELLLQQKGSLLRMAVSEGAYVGKAAAAVDQIGAVTARKVTTRFADMGRVDAQTDQRWVYPVDYDLPQLIDSFDKLRLITDPNSKYVQNGVFAMGRAMDDEIISAFFGTAKTGQDGGTSTAFDTANQQIAVNHGSASNVGLTVKKLIKAREILSANLVDPEEEIFCAISAKQHTNLLNEIQVVSTDYNDRPVLVDGEVKKFLKINFIQIERLGVDGSSYRRVPVWTKSGMHLGIWNDIETDVSQRKDLQGLPWQAYCVETIGATRTNEDKVIEILCSEA